MRRVMVSTLSRRAVSCLKSHHHRVGGFDFSRCPTTECDRAAPLQNNRWFMSTQRNRFNTANSYDRLNVESDEEKEEAIRIQVISKEHIKPSSPTPQNLRYYKLSMLDQIEIPIYYDFIFFYRNHNNKNVEEVIRERSNHLKQSLSETLSRFYPFAGKVASELHIDCNDEGVYFIETRIDDRLENLLKKPDNYNLIRRLIPTVNDSVPNQQLLGLYVSMVQVNFFNCGGVAVTVKQNHKLVDGGSYMTFLKAWAAIARRDPNQVNPSFVSSSMFPQLPRAPYIPIWCSTIVPSHLKYGKCATRRFVFDALALKELKTKASKQQPVSRIMAVLALLWKCIVKETQYSKASVLHIPVNIRSRCSPPLPEASIGNTILNTHVRFDPETSDFELASMAARLKNAVANVNSESIEELKGEKGHVRFLESLRNSIETFSDFKTEYYLTTSICNSGSNEVDFGWGKPVWLCTGQLNEDISVFTNRMIMVDACSGDGIEVWVTLEEQVMNVVECDVELLTFASVDPSPL